MKTLVFVSLFLSSLCHNFPIANLTTRETVHYVRFAKCYVREIYSLYSTYARGENKPSIAFSTSPTPGSYTFKDNREFWEWQHFFIKSNQTYTESSKLHVQVSENCNMIAECWAKKKKKEWNWERRPINMSQCAIESCGFQ